MEKFIPTVEQLCADVSSIFIDEGQDFQYILERLKYHLDENQPDNIPSLTYEEVIEKYRQHIEAWNVRNGEKERKGYLNRDQLRKRKNFLEFLDTRMYKIEWANTNFSHQRDTYLFGTLVSRTELISQLNDFKNYGRRNEG